jgi:hypothetical protein
MKVCVLYRPDSEYARQTEEFLRDFGKYSPSKVEILNPDTREGSSLATLYDTQTYPAILVLKEDGQLLKSWEGSKLPLMNEVIAYLQA